MKKLIVIITILVLGFNSAFAASTATNAIKVDANSMIDMTPIKKRTATVANTVNANTNTIAKSAATNLTSNTTSNFSTNPTAIGSSKAQTSNVGANISKAADQMMDKTNTPSNAVIVNYN